MDPLKGLRCLLRNFIVLLASFTVWVVACLFEAAVWMADLESIRRMAFLKAVGLASSCIYILCITWIIKCSINTVSVCKIS